MVLTRFSTNNNSIRPSERLNKNCKISNISCPNWELVLLEKNNKQSQRVLYLTAINKYCSKEVNYYVEFTLTPYYHIYKIYTWLCIIPTNKSNTLKRPERGCTTKSLSSLFIINSIFDNNNNINNNVNIIDNNSKTATTAWATSTSCHTKIHLMRATVRVRTMLMTMCVIVQNGFLLISNITYVYIYQLKPTLVHLHLY